MKIRFTLSRFDLLRANLQMILRNRFLWIMWGLLTVVISCSWLTDGKFEGKTTVYIISMVIISAIMYFVILFGITALLTSATVLMRKHVGVLGEHTLSIEDDGIIEETDHNISRNKWTSYHKTRIRGGYAFLYITEAQIHLIPLRRPLLEGDVQAFLEAVDDKTKRP